MNNIQSTLVRIYIKNATLSVSVIFPKLMWVLLIVLSMQYALVETIKVVLA